MDHATVADHVRGYIRANFLYARPDFALGDDDPLLGKGVIDSLGVVEVLEFIQIEYGFKLDDAEITEANLGSVGAIARLVLSKRGERAA